MLLPDKLRSAELGIATGMPMDECFLALEAASVLHQTRTNRVEKWARHQFSIGGGTWYGQLYGNDSTGLSLVRIYLHVTQDFWNRKFGEVSNEQSHAELATAWESSIAVFEQTIDAWSAIIGTPDWSGHQGSPDYPLDQGASHLAYWDIASERLQIDIVQEDQEFPILVAITCNPISDHSEV
jgi:hypothetical protein